MKSEGLKTTQSRNIKPDLAQRDRARSHKEKPRSAKKEIIKTFAAKWRQRADTPRGLASGGGADIC